MVLSESASESECKSESERENRNKTFTCFFRDYLTSFLNQFICIFFSSHYLLYQAFSFCIYRSQ